MAGRFASTATLALTTWSLVGCYAYVPVATSRPAAAAGEVRVVLNDAGSEFVRQTLGGGVREIEGVIIRTTSDTIVLTVEQTTTSSRERFVSKGDTVAVPVKLAERIAVKEYSRKRTVMVVISIATAIILAVAGVQNGASTSGTSQPGTVQP